MIKELELIKKKKYIIENCYSAGKISTSTYEKIDNDLTAVWINFQTNRKFFNKIITAREEILKKQNNFLEKLLAYFDMLYNSGKIKKEIYTKKNMTIIQGITATDQELNDIKESLRISLQTTLDCDLKSSFQLKERSPFFKSRVGKILISEKMKNELEAKASP